MKILIVENHIKAGAAEYLTKPTSVLELRQAIEKLTAISHELRG